MDSYYNHSIWYIWKALISFIFSYIPLPQTPLPGVELSKGCLPSFNEYVSHCTCTMSETHITRKCLNFQRLLGCPRSMFPHCFIEIPIYYFFSPPLQQWLLLHPPAKSPWQSCLKRVKAMIKLIEHCTAWYKLELYPQPHSSLTHTCIPTQVTQDPKFAV